MLDFKRNYILEDERVLLRPLCSEDVEHLRIFSINEPELWKYSSQKADNEEALVNYVSTAMSNREKLMEYPFIVFDKKTQQFAGSTRYYDIQLSHQTLQLGYTWYGKEFHGTGLNKHCKFLLLHFAFETLKMERVEFRADLKNARSIAAMKSIGCIEEGVLRSNMSLPDNRRRDSIVLSILKDEWFNTVKEELKKKIY